MKRVLFIIMSMLMTFQTATAAAETFTLKSPGEKTIVATALPNGMKFSGYEGKPVVVNFFGKQCRYCKQEIPHLAALQKRFGDRIGVIGIHVQEHMGGDELKALQQSLGINYPVYEYDDNIEIVRHIGSRARFNGSIPFNIFFNAKGEVEGIIPGYVEEKQLETIFSEMLKR